MVSLDPRVRSLLVAVSIAVLGLAVGLLLLLALGLGAGVLGVEFSPIVLVVLSLISFQGVAFGGVALLYLRYRGVGLDYVGARVPGGRDLLLAVAGYVGAFGSIIVIGTLVGLLGVETGTNQAAELGREAPETLLLLVPASFLLIGPGEELLYRGVVQNRLRETFDAVPGIVLASAIFAGVHFVALTGGASARLVTVGILFFPSLVFGTIYELTDNIAVPALVHATYNATLFSLLYVALRFADLGAEMGLLAPV